MKTSFFILFFSLLCSMIRAQNFSGGSGSSLDPYLIGTKADLKYLSENATVWNKNFKQIADIIFVNTDFAPGGDFYNNGQGFLPIGSLSGDYNGQYYKIDGLYINRPASSGVGFFGVSTYPSWPKITNIVLKNVNITGKNYVGALVGRLETKTVYNCYADGVVNGENYVGGLIGMQSDASIVSSCSDITVNGVMYVGGISGMLSAGSYCFNSYSSGDISGSDYVAGLVGKMLSSCNPFGDCISPGLSRCYSSGLVSGVTNIGGLVGNLWSASNTCFWDIQTSGQNTSGTGIGKTTAQLRTQSTFVGWDFVGETTNGTMDIWKFDQCTNNGCPILSWQNTASCQTELTNSSCGDTLTAMTEALYSDAVSGATNYRYWVQNASTGYSFVAIRAASDNLFRMSWITSNPVKYGTTYTVQVSAYVSGVWQAYGTACTVTTPPTRLQASSCGITLSNMADAVYCYPVADATNYRFQVVHVASGFTKVATSNSATNNFFRMSWFNSGLILGATYTVQASAYVGGSWQAYGPSCTITTPSTLTKLATASCNISVPALTSALYSDAVAGATNFRYEVVNVAAGFSKIATRAASDNLFRLSWLTGIELNTTYTIRVSAYLNGIWQAYGTACTVTTPAAIMADEEIVLEHNNGLSLGEDLILETFPNPNTGSFTVSTNAAGRFQLTNEIGQLIQTLEITEENGFQTKVEGLGAGVYFVTGIVDETVLTRKIVVQ